MAGASPPTVDVAVTIVQRADGHVLLAERTAHQIAPGFWELPGGKIDPGETPQAAAARELFEEIGIRPRALRPWAVYEHAFRTKRVRLHFFRVEGWNGTPQGCEGQRLAWADPAAPTVSPILPSNVRVLAGLGLSPINFVADESRPDEDFFALLPAALGAGVRLFQIRKPHLAPDQRVAFVRRVVTQARPWGAHVLVVGSALEARRGGATGVHSTCAQLRKMDARPPVAMWSASCHDAADLARAVALGADLATLSPVLPNADSPRPALGWSVFSDLVAAAPLPVFAYGGTTPALLGRARHAGAHGVATSSIEALFEGAVSQ
jgi:8-oxo-dGTP diphosphatase